MKMNNKLDNIILDFNMSISTAMFKDEQKVFISYYNQL